MALDRGDLVVEESTALSHDEAHESSTTTKEIAGKSPRQIAFSRLRRDKLAVFCTLTLVFLVLLAICAPLITRFFDIYWDVSDPNAPNTTDVLDFDGYPKIGPPFHGFTWDHPLGVAPRKGYDNLAYLLYGLRTSLVVCVLATVFSTLIGVVLGLVAGFSRGWLDRGISFFTDLLLSFPYLLAMLALAPIITSRFTTDLDMLAKAQVISLISILVIFGWMGLARLIRGQVLSLREREFILAAEVIGVPTRQILFKEMLPNLVAPIVISISLSLPAFVAAEAGLSFLGLGLTGYPSLGKMVADATPYYADYGLYLWLPVGAIALLTLSLNLLGDAVRDAFDPRTRR
ncbi:MAG TPA: ABC transporter permease [Nocardioides sp.]|uniref:ABC transporter permease n=1 Tax=uncultured Nocardioides sp. TaxID=198441 RepID=UPI0026102B74|nr:ABC transporter permease [uncultured Nocardioides sp.]HRD61210.1 ABC transporter permease [Nocardioides sp.]HRI94557.1 ABC transporter permease [Nocardioides sp.]HRK44722.1 ABC transporter permease [Nocardioides sp.]